MPRAGRGGSRPYNDRVQADLLTVFGTRPQFVKLAPILAALRAEARRRGTRLRHAVVNTGQHWDANLSGVFERELRIPPPDFHLRAGGGSALSQVGRMLARLDPILDRALPRLLLVLGDTNSTLAGAIAAARRSIPLAHVEAGLRSFRRGQPEEVNRVVADRLSRLLFCPTRTAVRNLAREGIRAGVRLSGDVMIDTLRGAAPRTAEARRILRRHGVRPRGYRLATVHRAENTDTPTAIGRLLDVLAAVPKPLLLPLHPRTAAAIGRFFGRRALAWIPGLAILPPLGYREMIALEANAAAVLTDSGGVQKEAFWLGVPCVTLREETEWIETVRAGRNRLAGMTPRRVLHALVALPPQARAPAAALRRLFGPPGASRRIARDILRFLDAPRRVP